MTLFFVIAVPTGLLFVWGVLLYNRLVMLKQQVDNSWHQIDVQLKRRHDLIPNLVSTVRAYLKHEKNVFESVAAARAKAVSAVESGRAGQSSAAENELTRQLAALLLMVETYPDLKAARPVRELMEDMESTENRIAFARQQYNDSVFELNTSVQSFPNSAIARALGFKAAEYFEMKDLSVPKDRVVPDGEDAEG